MSRNRDPAPPVNSTPPQTLKRNVAAPITAFSPRRAAPLPSNVLRDLNTPDLVDISLAPGCELIIRGVGASKKGGVVHGTAACRK